METFSVTLPNGKVISGIPKGTTKESVMQKAIAKGIATDADFGKAQGETALEQEALVNGLQAPVPASPSGDIPLPEYGANFEESVRSLTAAGIDPNAMLDASKSKHIYSYGETVMPSQVKQSIELLRQQDPLMANNNVSFGDYVGDHVNQFLEGFSKDYEKRVGAATEAFARSGSDQQTYAETALQLGGATAGLIADGVGGGVATLVDMAVPPQAKAAAKDFASWISDTEAGRAAMQAAMGGLESYNEWAQMNPRWAADFESVVNIALLATPTKGKVNPSASQNADQVSALTKIGDQLETQWKKQNYKDKNVAMLDSVTDVSKSDDFIKYREGGVGEVKLKPYVETAINDVRSIEGFKVGGSPKKNLNTVLTAEYKTVKMLDETLKQSRNPVNIASVQRQADEAFAGLVDKALDPDAMKATIASVKQAMNNAITKNGGTTATGMWEARKALDKHFKAALDNIGNEGRQDLLEAVRVARDAMNTGLKTAAPQADDALRRLSSYKWAMDEGLTSKAAKQGHNILNRMSANVSKYVGAQRSAAFAIGAVAPTLTYGVSAPWIIGGAATGLAIVGTAQMLRWGFSPQNAKMILGKTLKGVDEALALAYKAGDKETIKALRADRIAFAEMLKQGVERWENGGKEEFEAATQEQQ